MFFLIGVILVKGNIGKKSTFFLHTIKNSVFLGSKEKNQIVWTLDKVTKVIARARLSLSVGLTILPRVVGSEEVKLSAKWRKSQSHCPK